MQIQISGKNLNYKQCPRCRVIIEKNKGCNQMKCIGCDYEFCWLCGKKYTTDHYSIYNCVGCPGMRFSINKYITIRRWPQTKKLVGQ
jgi:hypothetical protein